MSWQLALIFLAAAVPIMIYGFRFRTRFSKVARRSQDQAGDLATTVEESVHGIRVLKAFGRGKHALENFAEQAEELRQTEIEQGRAWPPSAWWSLLLPDVAFALASSSASCWPPRASSASASLVAFFATAAVLAAPIESIGFLLSMTLTAHRGRPVLRGHGRGRTPSPARTSPAARPASRASSASSNVTSATRTPPDKPILNDIDLWTSAPARPWRSWASPAAARAPCSSWSPASTT